MIDHPDTPDTVREQAADWFAQRDEMAHSLITRQRFEQWRATDPRHASAYAELETMWENRAFEQALKDLAVDLELPPPPLTAKPPRMRLMAAAAAVLLALGVGWMADVPMRLQADHMTDVAQLERFDLEDGSHIVLGSHSAISTAFDGAHRRIKLLRGELYVEAAHDASRPLSIETAEASVTVVGTQFSVSQRGSGVTVAVRQGQVRFTNRKGEQSLLQAGNWQQLRDGQLQPLSLEGSERQMAWINGRLSFQNAPLAQVLEEIRRYYPAPILLFNDAAAGERVSGNYRLDDPLAIVTALSKVTSTQVQRLPGGILVIR
ncbi:FecR domain-containing protein [Pseudomonas sp. MAFF 301449]|uniref:FecR domain-containing protein n=1 Tax=Pseudomonas cyclaminis TaxID=2781239 RepID=A0ABR9SMD9_9PSED|nr:FecR domain-containing protein [Pseudomonas cyclaminis]MBE8590090.1 FecR domain-containing protein [Pseudomonas cyclaminis]MBE8603274.1 FecR domain-containing protein [Pseudomonas cyclaminis]